MVKGADKDTQKLIRAATKAWGQDSVKVTGGNHIQFKIPGGGIIVGAMSGCGPGQRKLKAQLIKAGLRP